MRHWQLFLFCFFLGIPFAAADLVTNSDQMRFEPTAAFVGKPVTIYLSIHNLSSVDARGSVKFYDELEQRSLGDQTLAALAQSSDRIFLQFTPKVVGEHPIAAKIIPWDENTDNPANNKVIKSIFVDEDTDGDGIGNEKDEDDDGDGVKDTEDTFPLDPKEWADTDGDGEGNTADDDDDNDGIKDIADAFPLDPTESEDLDQDGIGDNADTDWDGDNLSNDAEKSLGTDPRKADTDGDRVEDGDDDFPLDPDKDFDTDKDGTPDDQDNDDDGDGVADSHDLFPKDSGETTDADQDGIGDNADLDDDNDGLSDEEEILAGSDPHKADTDYDGFADGIDALPLNPDEHLDADHDGLGDKEDPNDANKGPVIAVWTSAEQVQKGEQVAFDASRSYDPEGGALQYEWTLPDGNTRQGSRIEYIFDRSGKRKITLTVTDSAGESRKQDVFVQVARSAAEKYLWGFIVTLIVVLALSRGKKKSSGSSNTAQSSESADTKKEG